MRDIWLVTWVFVGLGFTFRFPFVGVLLWEWFSLMNPHREAYGFSQSLPLNLIIALTTLFSWLISKEPKRIPTHTILVLLALFLVWMTFNSFFAFNPTWSWPFWDRTWRIFIFGFVVAGLATNRTRIDALIWVAVISLLYYGIKGGVFTLETGGVYKVYGPDGTIIGDNNQLALALLMVLPLVEYLRTSISYKPLSWLLVASMGFTLIAIIGSYSRGAYIAMGAIAILALLKARRKFVFLAVLAVAAAAIYHFTPQEIVDRAATIQSADSDASFHGRVVAWQVAFKYATDHFPFGAGFYGPQLSGIFNHYFPDEVAHAAHSIYFQALGEHGLIGLALYLALAFVSFAAYWRLARTPQQEETLWIQKLAGMIQISLFAFLIGGAALSMAYYDLFILLICIFPPLARLSQKQSVKQPAFRAAGRAVSNAA
jgi:probable O-glycosylation ligase (exosortase A-associated)